MVTNFILLFWKMWKNFVELVHFQQRYFIGNGLTADDLLAHHAPWHKSCHLKYSTSKLTRAKKRKADCNEPERMPRKRQAMNFANCLFCDKGSAVGDLRQIVTFDADASIRDMVVALQDTQIFAKIDGSDLIAKEVKYHLKCLISLKNRYTCRSHKRKHVHEPNNVQVYMNESRVFVELTNYMKTAVESGSLPFKLTDIILFISNDLVILA